LGAALVPSLEQAAKKSNYNCSSKAFLADKKFGELSVDIKKKKNKQ
jgi:hypothetical protein